MDQVRQVLGWLKRHHFWVLVAVATAVALGCWFQGANALYQEFQRNKQTIQEEFTKQSNLRNQPFHANETINERQQAEIAKQRERVDALWRQLYERQRADVLKWPGNLSEEFHRYIERCKFGETIHSDLRDHYNNYVRDHFPELPKVVGALEMSDDGRGSSYNLRGLRGGRGGRGMEMEGGLGRRDADDLATQEEDYVVVWHDQQRIREELYMPTTPSSKRIWVTQEDLWVYEALLGIIARTNQAKGADRYSNAAIREIYSLEVGRPAAQASRGRGRIEMLVAPGGAGGDMMGPDAMGIGREGIDTMGRGGGMEEYGRGGPMGEMSYGGYGEIDRSGRVLGEGTGDAGLFTGRYLGEDGQPITSSGDGGPEEFGREFKRLPIRMQLEMDQRWLPHLIAECANAPLQVEVNEVLINPSGGLDSSGGGSYGRRGGGELFSSARGVSGELMEPEREPNIKPVAIQGTIFIFNPPTEDASSQQLADVQ